MESISSQLPAHLQLEIHLQLNKRMVEQVKLFRGCPPEFYNVLVTKLQPCICVAGDYVFFAGERGFSMYLVKRVLAEALSDDRTVARFRETDFFGEIALISDQPRTADVRAVTDCM